MNTPKRVKIKTHLPILNNLSLEKEGLSGSVEFLFSIGASFFELVVSFVLLTTSSFFNNNSIFSPFATLFSDCFIEMI